ncbi:hypothetical protein [Iamia sp.]|uniref:hypothetical protein n=1 Tax=Iamia sp. TaxID=2722710 RepID=UPI002B66C14A|nr:hypothetical protein [Iamia sp.]HXH59601.1 hypothetical protein [Iamia sp.]
MATEGTHTEGFVEQRPAPGVLLRHRGAEVEVHPAGRDAPRVEIRRGAAWLRATDEGPGVWFTHGATTLQIRSGAAVVEVLDFEALVVVVAGRAAVKGTAALPRSVIAGQAVTLTLDGTFTAPETLAAGELAADRMVVENLALDSMGSATPTVPAPVDPDHDPEDEPPETAPELAAEAPPTPAVPVDGPAPAPPAVPAPERTAWPASSPSHSTENGPSALDAARAGVGAVDQGGEEGPDARAGGDAPTVDAPADGAGDDEPRPPATTGTAPTATGPDERSRRRVLLALFVALLVALAIVAAIALGGEDDPGTTAARPGTTAARPGTTVAGPAGALSEPEVPVEPETDDDEPSGPVTRPPPDTVAALETCAAAADGYRAQGTVQGGGQLTSRYEVTVGLVDPDGEVYADEVGRVVPQPDRSSPSQWMLTVPVTEAEARPGTECQLIDAVALRIEPR